MSVLLKFAFLLVFIALTLAEENQSAETEESTPSIANMVAMLDRIKSATHALQERLNPLLAAQGDKNPEEPSISETQAAEELGRETMKIENPQANPETGESTPSIANMVAMLNRIKSASHALQERLNPLITAEGDENPEGNPPANPETGSTPSVAGMVAMLDRIKSATHALQERLNPLLMAEARKKPERPSNSHSVTRKHRDSSSEKPKLTTRHYVKEVFYNNHFTCTMNCTHDEPLPRNCKEATAVEKTEGIYLIDPLPGSLRPFYAYCRYDDYNLSEGPWMVIQRRQDGSTDFFKGWVAYKLGFGDLRNEFWIGLQRLHQLTVEASYELLVQMTSFNGVSSYAKYTQFSVADETDCFRLTVGGFKGTAKNALEFHNNNRFSTFDHSPHDGIVNCANDERSGWWFSDCAHWLVATVLPFSAKKLELQCMLYIFETNNIHSIQKILRKNVNLNAPFNTAWVSSFSMRWAIPAEKPGGILHTVYMAIRPYEV